MGVRGGVEQPRRNCHSRGEEDRRLCPSWLVPPQDPDEAGDKGWQEGDLWQGGDGEGEACEEDREGIPRQGHQGQLVRPFRCSGFWSVVLIALVPCGLVGSMSPWRKFVH